MNEILKMHTEDYQMKNLFGGYYKISALFSVEIPKIV